MKSTGVSDSLRTASATEPKSRARFIADDRGPIKVVSVYEPALGLKAVLVVDSVAGGPSIGGLRMAPEVSTRECARLARAMWFWMCDP